MRLYRHFLTIATILGLACSGLLALPAGSAMVGAPQIGARAGLSPSAGIDLDDVTRSSDVIFTDVMKQALPWTSDRALAVGEDGNVRRLASKQTAQTTMLQSAVYPAGAYTLLWDGHGALEIDPQSGHITQLAAGRATVQMYAANGYGIRLRLSATDARNYVRNVRLILPGFASLYTRQVFAPSYLARLAPFDVVRFVHWSQADRLASSAMWPQRPTVDRFTQGGAGGVALEYQIALANAVGANPWFVIPAGATNFYITQTAALVHARLDGRLHAFFEYAPDAWRAGSATNAYAMMAGRNFGLASDAQGAAVAWYARRSLQMFGMIREVFGADAGRITRVLSGPPVLRTAPAAALARALVGSVRGGQGADVFAVDARMLTPAALADTQALAVGSGLRLVASEGAIAFAGAPDSRLIRSALDAWHASGGGLYVASSVSEYIADAGLQSRVSAALERSLDATQYAALSSYARAYPTAHVTPMTQAAAVDPAPAMFATSYIPSAAAAPALAAEAAATRAHASAVRAAASAMGIDINVGGGATGSWAADEYGSGGTVSHGTTAEIDTSGVTNPAPEAVYQTGRYGSSFSYVIPGLTPSASYTVNLHFAEYNYSSAGQRVGTYAINGNTVLSNFDIYAAAGEFKAVVRGFSVTSSGSGTITIAVTSPTTKNAFLNGIEIIAGGAPPPPPPTDMLQFHNDTLRSGWNSNETTLTTANVASSKFKLLQTLNVDGLVLAQPLYVSNYSVSADGGRTHNVLIIATENDTVYAFDADSGSLLWQHNIGTAQPYTDVGGDPNKGCTDIVPSYGINSTPAIDRSSGRIYVVAASEPSKGVFHTRLHALSIGSGADILPAVSISASNVMSNGSTIAFDPAQNMQRASILFANNSLYLGFGSHCDYALTSVSGWLMQYNPSNLQQITAFNTIEDSVPAGNSELGSIWGSGFGPAADAQGNIYAVTGNGAFDASTSGHNYAMSVLRFSPNIAAGVQDWFAYHFESQDSSRDLDFGSGGVMLLPTQTGLPQQNTLVGMGKSSYMYLLNQASLGKFTSNDSGALSIATSGTRGLWGGPAFFQAPAGPTIFYQTDSDFMRAFTVTSSGGKATLTNTQSGTTTSGYGGSMPVVSSNGQQSGTGIVWSVRRIANNGQNSTEDLDAYDATNLKSHLFAQYSGTWSKSDATEFVSPLVANGKVYVGAYKTVTVFGLTP